jgi:8-oxo-dGTP pyrophosphatase MutT (NUDIX family)|tara:strand:+ start:1682 stop:2356 length:675 start_codon:yes stop_codon:yes gene_type:complete
MEKLLRYMKIKKDISSNYLSSIFSSKNEISHDYFDKLAIRTDENINQNEKIINFLDKKLIRAAVLVPIIFDGDKCSILLTHRSAELKDHANQISFPGGRIDENDISPVHTAVRETYEEIGIDEKHVNIIGNLDTYITGTGFQILPIIAQIDRKYKININSKEVESIFKLPIDFLMDKSNHEVDKKLYNNGNISYDYNFNVINYETHYIWGATASILLNLYEKLK